MAPCPCKHVSSPFGYIPVLPSHFISQLGEFSIHCEKFRNPKLKNCPRSLNGTFSWRCRICPGWWSDSVHPEILHTSLNHRSPHFKNNLLDRKYVLANIFPLPLTPWPHVSPVWSTLETAIRHRTGSDNTVKRLFHVFHFYMWQFSNHICSLSTIATYFFSAMVHLNELSLSKATSLQKITSQTERKTKVSMHKVNKTLVSCKCL